LTLGWFGSINNQRVDTSFPRCRIINLLPPRRLRFVPVCLSVNRITRKCMGERSRNYRKRGSIRAEKNRL